MQLLFLFACQDAPVAPTADDSSSPAFAKGGNPGKPGGGGGGGGGGSPAPAEIVYTGKVKAFGLAGMAADGSGNSLIWKCRDSCWRPSWSPDGSRIVFDYLDRGSINLRIVNSDGSGLVQLTQGTHDSNADWSPDGSRIAFTRLIGDHAVIHIIDADGTNLTPLTPAGDYSDDDPAWSPDGTRIVFSRTYGSVLSPYGWGLFVMDADGTNVQQITAPSPTDEYSDGDPAWSPDGSLIAFNRDAEAFAYRRIHVIQPDGTGLADLTPALDHNASYPSWSPDGSQIVFDGTNWGIYTMDADGSNVTEVDPPSSSAQFPDWNPAAVAP